MNRVDHVQARMYKMGGGSCFVLKFIKEDASVFNLMIDAGCASHNQGHYTGHLEELIDFIGNTIDLLIITQNHRDHVGLFDSYQEMLTERLTVKKIWMGWLEDKSDQKARKWDKELREKKKALSIANSELTKLTESESFSNQFSDQFGGKNSIRMYKHFAKVLNEFVSLYMSMEKGHGNSGILHGMTVIKHNLGCDNIDYLRRGEVKEHLENLPGVRFYILGPDYEDHLHNTSRKGGSILSSSNSFSESVQNMQNGQTGHAPFSPEYEDNCSAQQSCYGKQGEEWRKADHDWLIYSSGALALRLAVQAKSHSLAFAIELEDSNKVLLFPGTADSHIRNSWHEITWPGSLKTKDLLDRTVLHQVVHSEDLWDHCNAGSMTNHEVVAMTTAPYKTILKEWKAVAQNQSVFSELLKKTKGRVLFAKDESQDTGILDAIEIAQKRMSPSEAQVFEQNVTEHEFYIQYAITG